MTYAAFTPEDFASLDDSGMPAPKRMPQATLCAVALALSTSIGAWMLYGGLHASPTSGTAAPVVAAAPAPIPALRLASTAPSTATPVVKRYNALFDPRLTTAAAPVTFAQSAALRAGFEPFRRRESELTPSITVAAVSPQEIAPQEIAPQAPAPQTSARDIAPQASTPQAVAPQTVVPQTAETPDVVPQVAPTSPVVSELSRDVPMPVPRPAFAAPGRTVVPQTTGTERAEREPTRVAVAPSTGAQPTFFDKLFGEPKQPNGPALAYASPEDGALGNVLKGTLGQPRGYDRYTAVYNISAHTVTLPDGTQLEAHSGLGSALDNPRSVNLRMVGATPPNFYDLTQREALFHGVRALRLTPTGGTTFGRAGLLAHTYMLRGHSGESNGCVVFKNYQAFLRAYDSGAIKHLAVVAGI